MTRVVTWNVNSIRARRDRVCAWVERHTPDVLALQETRCRDADFPTADLAALGYESAHWGVDHRNGVALCSRVGLDEVRRGFRGPNRPPFDEARLISARCGDLVVHSAYVPNGRELWDPHYAFKLVWLERLRGEVDPSVPSIAAGDFNVAPADLDIYDPSRWKRRTHASPPERAGIAALEDLGLVDLHRRARPDESALFTWWSQRPGMFETNRGLRIDLLLASAPVADRLIDVWVDTVERAGERPSDHAPVVADLAPVGTSPAHGAGPTATP